MLDFNVLKNNILAVFKNKHVYNTKKSNRENKVQYTYSTNYIAN